MADGFGFESYRSTKTVVSESVCFKSREDEDALMIIAALRFKRFQFVPRRTTEMQWTVFPWWQQLLTRVSFLFFIFQRNQPSHFVFQVYQFLHGALYGAAWGAVSLFLPCIRVKSCCCSYSHFPPFLRLRPFQLLVLLQQQEVCCCFVCTYLSIDCLTRISKCIDATFRCRFSFSFSFFHPSHCYIRGGHGRLSSHCSI
jgi:hypothetical protein